MTMEHGADRLFSRNLSMGEYLKRAYDRTPRPLRCAALSEPEWQAWRETFTRTLHDLMGPWPEPCPLNSVTIERVQREGFVQEKILFSSERDMAVSAYVLIPTSLPTGERYPTIICQHGHGYGKDDVVDITHGTVKQWGLGRRERYGYGAHFARKGYLVLAMDARGFGERALGYAFGSHEDKIGDDSCQGCNIMQIKAQLLGLNMFTLNVFDLLRCIDYLTTRPDVDAERIGCAGLSYGGGLTLFATALDERIKAAVVSGFLASLYDETFERGDTCGQQIVPQLLRWGELSDVACLVAPRALLIESGSTDELFGIEAARQAFGEVQRLYRVLEAPEKVAQHVFAGGHRWDGAQADAFFERWL